MIKEFINDLIENNNKYYEKIEKCQKWINEGKSVEYFKDNLETYQLIINENNEKISLAYQFIELADKENFIISKSPLSNSFYAHKEGEKIDWGYKPEGSYRFSDHWSFHKNGETHCEVDDGTLNYMVKNNNWNCICKMVDGLYERIE